MTPRYYEMLRDDYKENVDKVEVEVTEDGGPIDENNRPEHTCLEDRWKCPKCGELHDSEDAAVDCCFPFYHVEDSMNRER